MESGTHEGNYQEEIVRPLVLWPSLGVTKLNFELVYKLLGSSDPRGSGETLLYLDVVICKPSGSPTFNRNCSREANIKLPMMPLMRVCLIPGIRCLITWLYQG